MSTVVDRELGPEPRRSAEGRPAVPATSGPRHAAVASTPVAPAPPPEVEPEVIRTRTGSRREDVLPVVGATLASAALTTFLFTTVFPYPGLLGSLVVWGVVFLVALAALVRLDGDAELVKDRVAAAAIYLLGGSLLLALVVVVAFTLWRGREALTHGNFVTEDMSRAGPLDPLTVGGIKHAVAGTLVMMTLSLGFTIPVALVTAVFLSETRGGFTRFVRTIVEAMTALPSVVAGLFVYAVIVTLQAAVGWGAQSGLAASVALGVMMLPIMVRAADVVLRLVAGNLKEAAAALGAPRWRVVWHVVLPTARSGLMTAIILGAARGVGETSPVLLTAGYTTGFNIDPLDGPMVSLPLLTFSLTKSPEPGYVARGFGAAAALMLIVLVLFVVARLVGGRQPGDLSRVQQRRRDRQSRDDADRIVQRERARAVPSSDPVFGGDPGASS